MATVAAPLPAWYDILVTQSYKPEGRLLNPLSAHFKAGSIKSAHLTV
jgi:hypothetical protein